MCVETVFTYLLAEAVNPRMVENRAALDADGVYALSALSSFVRTSIFPGAFSSILAESNEHRRRRG